MPRGAWPTGPPPGRATRRRGRCRSTAMPPADSAGPASRGQPTLPAAHLCARIMRSPRAQGCAQALLRARGQHVARHAPHHRRCHAGAGTVVRWLRQLGKGDRSVDAGSPVLTAEEAARWLRVPLKTLLQQAREGRIPRASKVGKHWLFHRAGLEELFEPTNVEVVGKSVRADRAEPARTTRPRSPRKPGDRASIIQDLRSKK